MSGESLDLGTVNHFLLTKQHLTAASRSADIVQVVKDVAGLHATSSTTPYLSLFARSPKFERSDLEEELYTKRTLGKIRCVRKTIYIHTKDMIPVALGATGDMVAAASRRYMESRGISPEKYGRISRSILRLLKDQEMTAAAIRRTLDAEPDIPSVLYYMCDQGLLIRGRPEKGWKDRNHNYCLFHGYFPDVKLGALSQSEATTSLVMQYLASFGPATENDLTWWTGLGKGKVQAALKPLRDLLTKVTIAGLEGDFIMLQSDESPLRRTQPSHSPTVNLLPTLDPYLMGYRERARYLDEAYGEYVFDRSGNATSTVLLDGEVVGVWDFEQNPKDVKEPVVKLLLFRKVSPYIRNVIHTQARSVGQFIASSKVQIRECDTMVPLTKRTAGSMMTPLKGC